MITKTRLHQPSTAARLLYSALVVLLGVFVVYPVIRALLEPSWADVVRVFTTARWQQAAANTALITLLSTASAVLVGTAFAYVVTRGQAWLRGVFSAMPLLLLVTPPFVGGFAFILLFGRRGLVTYQLFGLEASPYGLHGLWVAQTLTFFPIAYLLMRSAFLRVNAALEHASLSLGASRWRTFTGVTLPLTLPGLLSSVLFIAISVLSDFGNPMLVGGRFRVLATEVYTQATGWGNFGTAAVLGFALLVPAIVLFLLYRMVFVKFGGRFTTELGRGQSLAAPAPPLLVRVIGTVFVGAVSALIIAQYAVIAFTAFTNIWGVDSTVTTKHFAYTLTRTNVVSNSLIFAFIAAVFGTVVAGLGAFFTSRTHVRLRGVTELVSLIPAAVPGTLLGVAFVLAFNGSPFHLGGTAIIVIIAMMVSYLPVGFRLFAAGFAQVSRSLDESASSLGASDLRVFWDVLLPILRGPAVAAFLFTFIQAVGTMSAVIFLVSFDTPLASVAILNLAEQGHWSRAAALSLVLISASFVALALLGRAGRRALISVGGRP